MANTEPIGTFPYKQFKDETIPESGCGGAAPYGSDVQMNSFACDDVISGDTADTQLRDVTCVPNNSPVGVLSFSGDSSARVEGSSLETRLQRSSCGTARVIMNGNLSSPSPESPGSPGARDLEEEWTWRNLILSLCSLCCCAACGMFATVLAMLAYVDHRVADYEAARIKRNAALRLAIAAIVTGTILLVIVIIVIVLRNMHV